MVVDALAPIWDQSARYDAIGIRVGRDERIIDLGLRYLGRSRMGRALLLLDANVLLRAALFDRPKFVF